jgi:hypothetical protein
MEQTPSLVESLEDCTMDTGSIAHLDHNGDTKYTWNRNNPIECDAAKEHFDTLRGKGFLVFKITRLGGTKGQPVKEFSPKAGGYLYTAPEMVRDFDPKGDYVVSPQMAGG